MPHAGGAQASLTKHTRHCDSFFRGVAPWKRLDPPVVEHLIELYFLTLNIYILHLGLRGLAEDSYGLIHLRAMAVTTWCRQLPILDIILRWCKRTRWWLIMRSPLCHLSNKRLSWTIPGRSSSDAIWLFQTYTTLCSWSCLVKRTFKKRNDNMAFIFSRFPSVVGETLLYLFILHLTCAGGICDTGLMPLIDLDLKNTKNEFIKKLQIPTMEAMMKICTAVCDECDEQKELKWFCETCEQNLCGECSSWIHLKVKMMLIPQIYVVVLKYPLWVPVSWGNSPDPPDSSSPRLVPSALFWIKVPPYREHERTTTSTNLVATLLMTKRNLQTSLIRLTLTVFAPICSRRRRRRRRSLM